MFGFDQDDCDVCGERLDGDVAEMYDPAHPEDESLICHAECGIARGLSVA